MMCELEQAPAALVKALLPSCRATKAGFSTSLRVQMGNYWAAGQSLPSGALTCRSADRTVKLWDVGQRSCVSTSPSIASVWGMAWQPVPSETFAAGKQFAVAGDDKAITLYRAAGAA